MVLKTSKNIIGKKVPLFSSLKPSEINVVMIICNHCPYVKFRMPAISKFVDDYKNIVNIIAVNSNDNTSYPEDGPEYMDEFKKYYNLKCDYFFDGDQSIAKAYEAVCTPEFYIIDKDGLVFYHGEFDPSHTSNNLTPSGSSLRHALDLCLTNKPLCFEPNSSFGCSIKWKM